MHEIVLFIPFRRSVFYTDPKSTAFSAPGLIYSCKWKFQQDPGTFAPWNFRSLEAGESFLGRIKAWYLSHTPHTISLCLGGGGWSAIRAPAPLM